ncbi:hypothetical protein ILYODFUR_019209 [Ilyodon furcidens]|uniref:Uncharacterized protein n=1 Tax=Ilyodon furcidens TaxID=33524 RepID=A0ABV0SZQ7_9TELE
MSRLPTSLSGGGLAHLSIESNVKSPVKRRSGLFPRLLSVDSQTDKHTHRSLLSEQRSFDCCHPMLEVRSELPSNPSSPEAGQRDRIHPKKESSKISRSTSSTCSFSIPADDVHLTRRVLSHLEDEDACSQMQLEITFMVAPWVGVRRKFRGSHFKTASSEASCPLIVCRSPTELKNKNSPRSNLKFRFDKLTHSAAGN